jgi:predicted ATPase/class 3 adenylate cyclase
VKHLEELGRVVARDAVSSAVTGTVTFLFSDLEGSTRLLHRLGNRYAQVLAAHRAIVRDAVREFDGREIDTAGDGFFLAFQRARDAVAAAVTIQRRMANTVWPDDADVRVRMGLHTGEPVWSAEGYVGLDVHRAARICSTAYGAQVLLSNSTRHLVEHDLPEGVSLRDLGAHRLKDLSEPEQLFQLVITGIRSDFPPPGPVSSGLLNFPAIPGRLIGRERDVDTVRSQLLREDVRLITLTGPGGTGKTRLSIAAAESAASAFEHGACFVPLSALTEPQLLPAAIANAIGIPESPSRTTIDVVAEHLRARRMLIVLDNFEQIVSAAPVIAELLFRCASLKMLVTSRIVLHLTGEHEYPVSPLALPDATEPENAVALRGSPAVALFVERARAVRPDFDLDDDNSSAVRELCVRLDGLPLALELAAARIRLFSPQALLGRLGRRLDLLKGGARDLPARHQTLRQAIAWSYELLEPAEQKLFRRLAVFMGSFSIDAAEAVCTAAGPVDIDVFDGIGALVERSLLRREAEVEGEPRFGMLETVREFGCERLEAHDEVHATRTAHAHVLLQELEQIVPRLTGPEQNACLNRIEADHDNLRAAITWSEEQGDADTALRLCSALWRFWIVRGHMREGYATLERVLAMPAAARPTAARARALLGLGTVTHEISEYQKATPMLEESLAIFRQLDDARGIAAATTSLGWVSELSGHMVLAQALSEEGLALHRQHVDRRGTAMTLNNLGWLDLTRGRLAAAREQFMESHQLLRELGDHRSAAYLAINIAWAERHCGQYDSARARVEQALLTLAMLRDRQITAFGLWSLACIALDLGDHERSWKLLAESLPLWTEVGNFLGRAWTLCTMAEVAYDLKDSARAPRLGTELIAECERRNARRVRLRVLGANGLLTTMSGDWRAGIAQLADTLDESERIDDLFPSLVALEALAPLALARAAPQLAARLHGTADAMRERTGSVRPPRITSQLAEVLARIEERIGADAAARAREQGRADELHASAAMVRSTLLT